MLYISSDVTFSGTIAYITVLAIFIIFARIVKPVTGLELYTGDRYGFIDGLRGLLAIAVFMHHFQLNQAMQLKNANWSDGFNVFSTLCASRAVSLFFMITGFLFWGKIIRTEGRPDWIQLFVSRIFRLTPLYWFMTLVFVGLMIFTWRFDLFKHPLDIVNFFAGNVFFQLPSLNDDANTHGLISGVTWTLSYEWFFYLMLPVLASLWLVSRSKPAIRWTLFAAVIFYCIIDPSFFSLKAHFFMFFLLGGTAVWLGTRPKIKKFAAKPIAAVIASGAIVLSVSEYNISSIHGNIFSYLLTAAHLPHGTQTTDLIDMILLFAFFGPVAWGCSIFGLLKTTGLRLLGEISYSTYLLHGLVIYIFFHLLWPTYFSQSVNIFGYWLPLLGTGLAVITVSFLTFRFIELPGMNFGKRILSMPPERKEEIPSS